MPQHTLLTSSSVRYEQEIGKINFKSDYVIENTILPDKATSVPRIVGWSGPARSGTSALLFLMAGIPQVNRVYFQPQKTLMRTGGPSFELYASDKLVCMKEVFGQYNSQENYDPVRLLLQAGVPADKITWICLLREPLQAFASWHEFCPSSPLFYSETQQHTINQFWQYRELGIKVIPFAYELLKGREEEVIRRLLAKADIPAENLSMHFDYQALKQKLEQGQAKDETYFKVNLEPTLARKRFVYSRNQYKVPSLLTHEVLSLCAPAFNDFYELAAYELGIKG